MDSDIVDNTALALKAASLPLPQGFEQVICTLYEGDYHLGVAALINSVVKAGFRGLFWIGHRGPLPPWTNSLHRSKDGLFEVGDALLGFESLQTERHLGQYKSRFLLDIVDRGITGRLLWYFDPDITVRCDWSFFENWTRYGICLCQDDGYGFMSSTHPIRSAWIELAEEEGWGSPKKKLDHYFNSGFIGFQIKYRDFLTQWVAALAMAHKSGVKPDQFQKGNRTQTFFTVDQDTMNIAAMYSDIPLSTMGAEGMTFINSGIFMYHSITSPKPWRKSFLRHALRGNPPTRADMHFLESAAGPLQPYTPQALKKMRRDAYIASKVGMVYRWSSR